MATGDVLLTLTPLQYAEYISLRDRLAEAERERDVWMREFYAAVDAGVEAIRAVQVERDRYRAALVGYSTWAHWQPCPALDGSEITMLCDWIGGGEGPDIAEKALASVTESGDK